MILVGNQRGGGRDLALYLMKDENEAVHVHELRGFAGHDLRSAFQESYAISKATRCKQHLFSLSLNPPKEAIVAVQDFEKAIATIEKKLGLTGQPRAIVFHEKRGLDGELRRHAHAVWCRIDMQNMKAVQLSYTKEKLQEIARGLFIQHGWIMPRGLLNRSERDPLNFTLGEWQQAKRTKQNPREIKKLFQDAWAVSDSPGAFAQALKQHAFVLAEGRRGHVAVDKDGEVYPISRWVGLKAKEVLERFGKTDKLPGIDQAQAAAAEVISTRLRTIRREEAHKHHRTLGALAAEKAAAGRKHLQEECVLVEFQESRRNRVRSLQQSRFRSGLLGLWDRITGRHQQIERAMTFETTRLQKKDARERTWLKSSYEKRVEVLEQQRQEARHQFSIVARVLAEDIHLLSRDVAEPSAAGRKLDRDLEPEP